MTMPAYSPAYIPALRFRWLTPVYDSIVNSLMRDRMLKRGIVEITKLLPGERVLDFGCGTGTLTILLKQSCPEAIVNGLDIDPDILAIAKRKARHNKLDIHYHKGSITAVPRAPEFAAGSYDCIVSSLVFHHLDLVQKKAALAEALRLLKPGGRFILADWGKPSNPLMRLAFIPVQLLDGFTTTHDSVTGKLPGLVAEAGFPDAEILRVVNTILGTFYYHIAYKPTL